MNILNSTQSFQNTGLDGYFRQCLLRQINQPGGMTQILLLPVGCEQQGSPFGRVIQDSFWRASETQLASLKTIPNTLAANSNLTPGDPCSLVSQYCWCRFDYHEYGLTKDQVKVINEVMTEQASKHLRFEEDKN